ncbi:hypothetical protein LCGC14_2524180, partial [marine sediment metagenome]
MQPLNNSKPVAIGSALVNKERMGKYKKQWAIENKEKRNAQLLYRYN